MLTQQNWHSFHFPTATNKVGVRESINGMWVYSFGDVHEKLIINESRHRLMIFIF